MNCALLYRYRFNISLLPHLILAVQHGSESNSIHVLTEDFFSICGVSIAGAALAISHYAGSSAWDAGGMVVIGGEDVDVCLVLIALRSKNLGQERNAPL